MPIDDPQGVARLSDMDPALALRVSRGADGDIHVFIAQPRMPLQDEDGNLAAVEFCASGGQSPHTRKALLALAEAIERDNQENPIADPDTK